MHLHFLGTIDPQPFDQALHAILKHYKLPEPLEIYILEHQRYGNLVLEHLPKEARTSFKIALHAGTSFSYDYQNNHYIIINLEGNKQAIYQKNYLQGLLTHEILHSIHYAKKLYTSLQKDYKQYYLQPLAKLTLPQKKKNVLEHIGRSASLMLKDWYVNTELIKKKEGKLLVDYYAINFTHKKTCPQPVFYEKLRPAVKKDPELLAIVFEFEFALLSFLLPLLKIHTKKAFAIRQHIESCYNLNMDEIERKLGSFVELYQDYFSPQKKFRKMFYTLLLEQTKNILN
ncbi:MAG TPA: hypothetical protein VJB87_04620 [Candidatus Nanoarchaeia archaeon]|nr:hypothetical protein [Candidatus Nanoarchaeia archaeon]